LVQASGGVWSGCVYDTDAVFHKTAETASYNQTIRPGTLSYGEYWVDFHHLKYAMGLVFDAMDQTCIRG
jgi:hypothetical protein